MKWITLILLVMPALAHSRCENYSRFGEKEVICWNKELKAYVSEKCSAGCDAVKFFLQPPKRPEAIDRTGGKNPATQYCKALDLRVHVLKDPRKAEQSFCAFPDGSLVDANAVARVLK